MAETPPDLYTDLLGIPPGPRPPNHYAMLRLPLFEPDPHIIHEALLRQTADLRRWALHPDPDRMRRVQELLNELSAAGVALEDPKTKGPYDEQLARQLGIALPASEPAAVQEVPQPAPAAPPAPAPRPVASTPPSPRPSPPTAEPAPATFWQAALDFLSAYWGWGLLAVGVLLAIWLPFALRRSPPEPQARSEVATATRPAPSKPTTAAVVGTPARPARPAPQPKSNKSPALEIAVVVAYTRWPFDVGAARRRQEQTAMALGVNLEEEVELGGGVKLDLVLIPAGRFDIGSPAGEQGRRDNEVQKTVTIEKPFWLGKYEVTQEQWQAMMGNNPAWFKGTKNPAESVSWDDCQTFLAKINGKVAGRVFRLPTEAEWEWACRAGAATRFSFGDADAELGEYAWHPSNSERRTHPVGQKKPNAWGLHDMHGNVWEWCASPYTDRFDGSESKGEDAPSPLRVLRGGSWSAVGGSWSPKPALCRCAERSSNYPAPAFGYVHVGLRLASSATSGAPGVPLLVTEAPMVALPPRPKAPEEGLPVAQPKPSEVTEPKARVEPGLQWPFDVREAKRRQEETAKALGVKVEEAVDLGGGVKLDLVLIPAGRFVIGSPPGEQDRDQDEDQQTVTIEKPFLIGKYEVTQEQWQGIMGSNPAGCKGTKNPVETVSWNDCCAFIGKLNQKVPGEGFRLPTEAEWEWACRAGAATAFHWGDSWNDLGDYAWSFDNSARSTQPVGRKKPNAWGLYDMAGNVWEWCASPYASWYNGSQQKSAGDPGACPVLRGGSWDCFGRNSCRCADRTLHLPSSRYRHYGFRVARTVSE